MSIIKLIIDYMNEYPISDEDRIFLRNYIAAYIKNGKFEIKEDENVTKQSLINDLKTITNNLETSTNTSIVARRLEIIRDILFKLMDEELKEEQLIDLSYTLEKLYIELGFPPRNNNTMINKIKNVRKYNEKNFRNITK